MNLSLTTPIYTFKLPSNGKEVQARPFLVGEEKVLLIAAESKDVKDITEATKAVITQCISPDSKVDINKLPFFDVDYLFIALRAKSIGETIDVQFLCENPLEDGTPCGGSFDATLNIQDVQISKRDDISPSIDMGDLHITMDYPTYDVMKQVGDDEIPLAGKIKIIAGSISRVIIKGSVKTRKDFTPLEMLKFVEGLTQQQFRKLETFIDNLPSFVVTAQATCPACGFNHFLRYDDFESFFL